MVVDTSISDYRVTVDGQELSDDLRAHLSLLRVEESLSLPATFMLRFHDPEFALLDSGFMKVGSEVELSLGWGSSLTSVMTGEVTSMTVEARPGEGHRIEVTGHDKMHRTMSGTNTRSFQNQSDADIARKLAQEHGLQADVDATGEPHDFLFQVNESDHSFLRTRARRIGFDYWVTKSTLHFKQAARTGAATAEWGVNLYRFKARMSSVAAAQSVEVRGWDDSQQQPIVGTATEHPNDPTDAAFYTDVLDAAKNFGDGRLTTSSVTVDSQGDADAAAAAMHHRSAAAGLVVRGELDGDPELGAGSTIQVEGLGATLSGEYLLTSVEHVLGAGQPFVTRFVSSGPDPARFPDLVAGAVDAGGQARSGLELTTAIVTNVNDPDELGRVRVKLSQMDDENETSWARVVSPGAGSDRGFQALPSVNDEVLVGFEHGDVSRPFVLGGLWSSKNRVPDASYHSDGSAERYLWRSTAGHEIELNDESDGSVTISLNGNKSSLKITKSEVTLTGEQMVKVTGNSIDVEATGKLSMKGRQVAIDGSQDVTVTGGMIKLN